MSEQRRRILVPMAWAVGALAVPCSAVPFAAAAPDAPSDAATAADAQPSDSGEDSESAAPSIGMCTESACSAPADRDKAADDGESAEESEGNESSGDNNSDEGDSGNGDADKDTDKDSDGAQSESARDAYEAADIKAGDQLLVGDWNKDGRSAFGVRRTGGIRLANLDGKVGSFAAYAFGGDSGRAVVGHWGTARDTVAIHDSGAVHLRRWFTSGPADRTFYYGEAGDELVSGDWDGDGYGGPAVRRGNTFYVRNNATTGIADFTFSFGDPGGQVLVGDFNGDGKDTVAVRNGATVRVLNTLADFSDTNTVELSSANARVVAGDFNGDGTTTIETVADTGAEADATPGDSSAHNTPAPDSADSSDTDSDNADSSDADTGNDSGQDGDGEATETPAGEATDGETAEEDSNTDGDDAGSDQTDAENNENTEGDDQPDATGTDAALGRLPRPEPDPENDESPQQIVGKDLDAGVYKVATTKDECFLSVVYADGKTQSGRVQGGPQAQVYLTLGDGDALAVTGCTVSNVSEDTPPEGAVPGDGEWLVGTDVAAGKFEVGGGENCFATVLASTERDAEIVYSLVGDTTAVEVSDGQLISSDSCTWSTLPE